MKPALLSTRGDHETRKGHEVFSNHYNLGGKHRGRGLACSYVNTFDAPAVVL